MNFSFPVSDEITYDEKMAVGTRCGETEYTQQRVNEYISWKQGKITMYELIEKYDKEILSSSNYEYYFLRQRKRWFGEHLIV